jgi:DNA-directed RNA polymerase specialized sigma24 family protein
MSKHVRIQKTRVIQGRKDSSKGEHSPYWDDAVKHGYYVDGELQERPQANPDVLPETEIATPSTPQLLMGEAIEHLAGRQKECYLLAMREDKSLAEVGEILGISKGSAQVYVDRAVKFISGYCKRAIAGGRV